MCGREGGVEGGRVKWKEGRWSRVEWKEGRWSGRREGGVEGGRVE